MTAIDQVMSTATLNRAKLHVYNVCQRGSSFTLVKPGTKDEMGEVLSESELSLNAFPVRFNPYDRKTKERISWAEDTDILCYVAKKQIDDVSISIEQLRRYLYLKYSGKRYSIRYVELYDAFHTDYLYVVIGGKK